MHVPKVDPRCAPENEIALILQHAERKIRDLLGPQYSVHCGIRLASTAVIQAPDTALSVAQVAEMLGKAENTVRALMQSGAIPASKIGGSWYTTCSAILDQLPSGLSRHASLLAAQRR